MSVWRLFFTPARLLRLGIISYIAIVTLAAWYKYDSYQMGFDLGVHEQVLWNTAHGRIAATSAFAGIDSYFGIDFIPTELLLAPLYALRPSVYTMLFLQTVALALGALPVFWIVRDRFTKLQAGHSSQSRMPSWAGVVFALAFLLYLPVEYMNLYEFQIRAFATTFLLMAWYALERRRFAPFLLWSLLALGCRSEVGLVLAGMGLAQLRMKNGELKKGASDARAFAQFSILNSQFLRFVALPIILGLGWFVLCLGVIIPAFRSGAPSLYLGVIYGQIDGQPWLGDSPGQIFRTLLTRPGFVLQEVFGHATRGPMRLRYLLEMFLPFGFLLLLQPRVLLITLPIFALNLLSNTPNIHASTHYHYQALIVPFMVVGSAYALAWLIQAQEQRTKNKEQRGQNQEPQNQEPRTENQEPGNSKLNTQNSKLAPHLVILSLSTVLLLSLLCNLVIFAPTPFNSRNPALSLLGSALKGSEAQARGQVIEQLLAQVPPDAALATTNKIGPHASRRERIFFFPGNVIYPADKIAQAEFLLIDQVDLLQDEKTRAERQQMLDALAASGQYQRLAEEQGVSLWRRVLPGN